MPIYLDYAATTPLDPRVRDAMLPWLGEHFGNPSSLHMFGQRAHLAVNEARLAVANTLGCESEEVFFTGSATEANNMILRGVARAREHLGKHIITSSIEHPCILNICRDLETQGFEVTYLPVDDQGRIHPDTFRAAIRPDTILASIQFANHEIGVIQPMKQLISIAAEHDLLIHTDAVAAFPHIHTGLGKYPVHALTLSPHKYYGPQGVGIAIIRAGMPIHPLIAGGSQEFGKRAGTHNVAGIVGAGRATELIEAEKYEESARLAALRDQTFVHLRSLLPDLRVFGSSEYRLPGHIPIGVAGSVGEHLLVELDIQGFAVSLGAACSSGSTEPSSVITALGISPEEARSFLRLTIGRYTTATELEQFATYYSESIQKRGSIRRQENRDVGVDILR